MGMNISGIYDRDWVDLDWSPWQSLRPTQDSQTGLPTVSGLYRVRHAELDGLVYIGETGRSIRGRIGALRNGIYEKEMPYRDPHTASPCLWAIVDRYGPALQVSVTTPPEASSKQQRKAMEDGLIAIHRRESGESPTANFARMIPGYKQSSYRKDGVIGGLLGHDGSEANAEPGIGPLDWENPQNLRSGNWMGLNWSPAEALGEAYDIPPQPGLYRIWDPDRPSPLEYVGETANLKSRLYRHRRNREKHLQYNYVEWAELDAKHKREEAETDLLGAHWLAVGKSPRDQY